MEYMATGQAKRYNAGKPRYDLIPTFAQEQYAKALTMGANKYGEHNWRKGMPWSSVIASLERHLEAIKRGEDYDKESGLLHTAHIMCNAGFLSEYYKIYPQGDDRLHHYLSTPRVCLDADIIVPSKDLGFPVNDILNASGKPEDELRDYLYEYNYENVNIYTSMREVVIGDVDILITNNYKVFLEYNKHRVCSFLLTSEDNEQYEVGHKRLYNLNDLWH